MPPKRRRRFQGLYYHSSPPKVLPMNGLITNSDGRRRRDIDDFSVKLSTIRIWMHEKDIGKLTRVLWAGQGNRLRQQASTNGKVKRFLAAVPYVMNSIRDVHQAVIDNSLETLQANLEPPLPPALVTCRDANGLNLIHKAAGLGHATILEYLITTWPDGVHETDITGKTPLHWAASAKNNMRCYTLLTQAGCDEEAVDYKIKTPAFYRHKPHEIERAFLTYVPEAPRVSPAIATDWEALSDDSGDGKKLDIKIPQLNGFGRHSNAESNENTSEAEMIETVSGHGKDEENAIHEDQDEGNALEVEQEKIDESEATVAEDDKENNDDTQEEKGEEDEVKLSYTEEHNDDQEEEEETLVTQEEEQKENEEPQDEKQQTQTHTEITANLIKDSNDKNNTENGNNESDKLALEKEDEFARKDLEDQEKAEHEKPPDLDQQEKIIDAQDDKTIEEENDVKNIGEILEDNRNDQKNNEALDETTKEFELQEKRESINKAEGKKGIGGEDTTDSKLQAGQVNDQESQDNFDEIKESDKENYKNQINDKTFGEALVDIKNEVKEDVKYLAKQIKNVFSDKKDTEDTGKEDAINNKDMIDTEIETQNEAGKTAASNQDLETGHEEHNTEELGETKENESRKDTNAEEPEAAEVEENFQDQTLVVSSASSDIKKEDTPDSNDNENEQTEIKANDAPTSSPKSNSSNKNIPTTITTPPPVKATKTSSKESTGNENDKTEEDENNNNSKLINDTAIPNTTITPKDDATKMNAAEAITDEQFKELEKSLQAYKNAEENDSEEKQSDSGNKSEEGMADNLKEPLNAVTSDLQNILSATNTTKNVDREINDVGQNARGPQEQTSGNKLLKDGESSDDTADEDEETQVEAEIAENGNKDQENSKLNAEEVQQTENEEELEPEPTQDPPLKPDTETNTNEEDSDNSNAATLNKNEQDRAGSPTPSLAIEGFVQGNAEDNTVQSQTAANIHDNEESRLQNIIATGDMEQLAQIVLNGDGEKLLNVEATEPEIQAFLSNVPNYMSKIRRVHEAARNGSLLNLQQSLDRRKFAIAKDKISPDGATPLHVAVLFGNSDIVRYLSARFPETTTITDSDGRTALHYAAVINDNGHFYNVLLQMGANPQMVDKMGHTPEDYLGKVELNDTLSYRQLLKRFGAEDLEEQLLSDQGRTENQSIQENPLFRTEQGKYLADNLADPLIKALTQVAQKRPNDPLQYLANYLQNYVASRNTNGRTITQAAVHSGSNQTNSTISATSDKSISQPARMNGHINYETAENIEEDLVQQQQQQRHGYDVNDDANDSDAAMSKKLEERDEHGQSMLHFACARSHRKGGLIHLIEDSKADITYRDELYRTARDVALQANQLGNAQELDRYVMSLAIVGDIKPFEYLALSGYDHIIDVLDDNETPIVEVVEARELHQLATYLRTIRPLEELREELHQMIRDNNVGRVKEIADGPNGKWLIRAKNYYGRTALHIAILKESVEIVEHFVNLCPEALKIGDNLERTPLHYAMGTNIIESISRILIQNGAKRTYKDLKGRQPSYYFMNKADILRLQEEEDESR